MSDSHFDDVADAYDESLPAHVVEHYLRKRTAFVRAHAAPGASVLDVGCGTGALAARIHQAGYDVSGVDSSQGMLRILRRRAPAIDAVLGSSARLPFADDRFDLAYCVAVMHHIAEATSVRLTLAEMVRV